MEMNKTATTRLLIREFLIKMEVNRAVVFGLLARVWSIIVGPITALFIASKFTPQLQGYYYTFSSLLALQVFAELGLGTVIIQFASHEWAGLKLNKNGCISGDSDSLSRLISLAKITVRWFTIGAILVGFGLGIGGYIFFLQSNIPNINWVAPWISLCFFSIWSIFLIPIWSILEGCNQVVSLYRFRFFQGVLTNVAVWGAILLNAGLWTASISTAVMLACAMFYLKCKYWNFLKTLFLEKPTGPKMEWRKDILPMQWRIALSWISGYFMVSFFTPVLFHYHGPVIAGQFGMTWAIAGSIGALSSAWLYPRVPQFGMLIAQKEYSKLDNLFWRLTKIFWFITVLIAAGMWFLVYLLNVFNYPIAKRILPLSLTGIFIIAQVISTISFPMSIYLRAHKKEPLLFLSIVSGILIGLSTLFLGKLYSVKGMGIGYLIVNIIMTPFVVLLWYRLRQEWHK